MLIYYTLLFIINNFILLCKFLYSIGYLPENPGMLSELLFTLWIQLITILFYRQKNNLTKIIIYATILSIILWSIVGFTLGSMGSYLILSLYQLLILFNLNIFSYPYNFLITIFSYCLSGLLYNILYVSGSLNIFVNILNKYTHWQEKFYKMIVSVYITLNSSNVLSSFLTLVIYGLVMSIWFYNVLRNYDDKDINNVTVAFPSDILFMVISFIIVSYERKLFTITGLVSGISILSLHIFCLFTFYLLFAKVCLEGITRIIESFFVSSKNVLFIILFSLPVINSQILFYMIVYSCLLVGIYFAFLNRKN